MVKLSIIAAMVYVLANQQVKSHSRAQQNDIPVIGTWLLEMHFIIGL